MTSHVFSCWQTVSPSSRGPWKLLLVGVTHAESNQTRKRGIRKDSTVKYKQTRRSNRHISECSAAEHETRQSQQQQRNLYLTCNRPAAY